MLGRWDVFGPLEDNVNILQTWAQELELLKRDFVFYFIAISALIKMPQSVGEFGFTWGIQLV